MVKDVKYRKPQEQEKKKVAMSKAFSDLFGPKKEKKVND